MLKEVLLEPGKVAERILYKFVRNIPDFDSHLNPFQFTQFFSTRALFTPACFAILKRSSWTALNANTFMGAFSSQISVLFSSKVFKPNW
jgi:hypothetical protein